VPTPRAAFDALYQAHLQPVHAYLLARTRDPELARDLAQETFLRAWRNIAEVGGLETGRQRAWLVAVARNLVIDRGRRARTERAATERAGRLPDTAGAADPADQAQLGRDVAAVDRAIASLPEEQRVLLSLQVMGGLTSNEIGELLGQPAGTVRYRLNQVRRQLRTALETEKEDT
jgi:RNA polymerase sigma-70 factor (ECF subfamily)